MRFPGAERLRSQAGMTLVELLVGMVMLGIVSAAILAALLFVMRAAATTQQRSFALGGNRVGIELFTRLVRQATLPPGGNSVNSTIITDAEPTKVVFTSRLADDPNVANNCQVKQYVFQLVGTNLQWGASPGPACGQSITTPWAYAAPAATNVITSGVRNQATPACPGAPTDVFTYYPSADAGDTSQALIQPLSTSPQLAAIGSVRIDLFTKEQPTQPAPGCQELKTRVDLRNQP